MWRGGDAGRVGGRLLVEFMDEYGINDLSPLSHLIRSRSEQIMPSLVCP